MLPSMTNDRTTARGNGVPVRPKQPRQVRQLDVVGTAEVADMLKVERPRIGRWVRRGVMPPTAAMLAATPVWYRKDIERMRPWVEANRRYRDREPVAS